MKKEEIEEMIKQKITAAFKDVIEIKTRYFDETLSLEVRVCPGGQNALDASALKEYAIAIEQFDGGGQLWVGTGKPYITLLIETLKIDELIKQDGKEPKES